MSKANAINGRSTSPSISLSQSDVSTFSDEDRRQGKKRRADKHHDSSRRARKEKESRKKKRRQSDDERGEDVKEKKRRRSDDERRNQRRHSDHESSEDVKESSRKKTHHSHDKCSEDERKKKRRLYKEAKRLLKKQESGATASNHLPSVESSGFENISDQDYYAKNNEFSTWLKEQQGVYFSDLSSDDTHRLFGEFVEAWNARKLSDKYYEGISRGPRTSHNWAFKDWKGIAKEDQEEKFLLDSKREKLEQKKFRKEQLSLLDELLPKETGRERIFEKKALRKEVAKARETSPEPLSEKDIMGGGDDFQRRLAQESSRKERVAKEKSALYNEKFSAYASKEAAAMDHMRALVELSGGKISIRKRDQDT